jgi:hypothetical protein
VPPPQPGPRLSYAAPLSYPDGVYHLTLTAPAVTASMSHRPARFRSRDPHRPSLRSGRRWVSPLRARIAPNRVQVHSASASSLAILGPLQVTSRCCGWVRQAPVLSQRAGWCQRAFLMHPSTATPSSSSLIRRSSWASTGADSTNRPETALTVRSAAVGTACAHPCVCTSCKVLIHDRAMTSSGQGRREACCPSPWG